jgi:putative ABC transport system permease protein
MRTPIHSPGLTIAVLALGIVASCLPFRDPSCPAMVWEKSERAGRSVISPGSFRDPGSLREWKSPNHVFGDLAGVEDIFSMNLTGAGEPEKVLAGAVTVNFFGMIGVQPMVGRAFLPGEDQYGRARVAILSHRLWRRRFAGEIGVVGRTITLSGERYRVVGILPPDFAWNNRQTDVWVPYAIDPSRDYRAGMARHSADSEPRPLGAG